MILERTTSSSPSSSGSPATSTSAAPTWSASSTASRSCSSSSRRPTATRQDAYDDNLRDYRDTIPQLFWHNALVILSNGGDAGRQPSPPLGALRRVEEDRRRGRAGRRLPRDRAIRGTCAPGRLLDLVENFVAFEEARGGLVKMLAQNHQFLGVNSAIAAVDADLGENAGGSASSGTPRARARAFDGLVRPEGAAHAAGQLDLRDRHRPHELDDQLHRDLRGSGAVTKDATSARRDSGAHLRELLRGNQRYVFTLIHKFRTERGRDAIPCSPTAPTSSSSPTRRTAASTTRSPLNMRRALPNAAFIGFTGTPLIAGEEKTREVFGDYVSIYNFAPVDRGRRDRPALLREPDPRAAARQRATSTSDLDAAARGGRARRGAGEARSSAVRARSTT